MHITRADPARLLPHYVRRFGVGEIQSREHSQDVRSALIFIAVTLFVVVLFALAGSSGIIIAAAAIGAVVVFGAVTVWLWHRPVHGIYVLFGAAVTTEVVYPSLGQQDLVGYIPFFADISSWANVHVIVSLGEIFMTTALLIWLLKSIADRSLRFDRGSLMLPLGLYMVMVLVGEIHGLSSGGDFRLSLWETRAQVYMLVAYILTCNLVRTRQHVMTLIWILILGTGVRAFEGTWRYLFLVRGHSIQGDLYPHEQAFYFNAFLILTLILFLYGGSRWMKRTTLLLFPFVVVADLGSQRRAGVLAIVVALVGLLLITLIAQPARRRAAALVLLVLAVGFPPYYMVYQNRSGVLAQPARAIASNFSPDPRDASSNLYRVNEDKDILATMRTSPILGYGFGKPMLTPYPLADISKIYEFWNVLPHNSILWIWMRLGSVGYLLFWFVIGSAIVQAMRLIRRLREMYLKGLALLIALLVVQEVIFGYLDLQWTNYRNLIVMGVLFALLSRLATFASAEEKSPEKVKTNSNPQIRGRAAPVSRTLAVVDGHLHR